MLGGSMPAISMRLLVADATDFVVVLT